MCLFFYPTLKTKKGKFAPRFWSRPNGQRDTTLENRQLRGVISGEMPRFSGQLRGTILGNRKTACPEGQAA